MPHINQNSLIALRPELSPGESVLWADQPSRRVIFHKQDWFLIPFSLLWGGFALLWEAAAMGLWQHGPRISGPLVFAELWGIPFVLIGQYLIWGRFFHAAWKRKRIHYAVTDRRVMVVQEGSKRQMASAYIDTLPVIFKESNSDGIGILRFGQTEPTTSRSGSSGAWGVITVGSVPAFVDIKDVESVYRVVSDLRERSRTEKAISF